MKSSLFALLLTLVCATGAAPLSPPFDERFQFLYFATIEGAHADGLTDAEVDRILLRNGGKGAFMHFIYACPICMPVLNGLLAYRTRPEFFGFKKMATHQSEHPTMGEGLSKELREELASDRQGVRLKAINALLTRWVDRRMEMLNLSPEQRKVWDKRFEDGRKEGMLMLENFRSQGSLKDLAPGFVDFKECAVCNAATKRSFMGPK